MRSLQFGISLGEFGARFAQAKTQLAKEPLTLPHFEMHAKFTAQKRRESRSIPHLGGQTELRGSGAECRFHLGQLSFMQPARPTWPFAFG